MELKVDFDNLRGFFKQIPTNTGVYIMKDNEDNVIYVGKAKNLRNRIKNYFTQNSDKRWFIVHLKSILDKIKIIVTENEKEALLLENNLIKRYKPRFNVYFRDDKSYLKLKLTIKEKFPRLIITREVKKDGNLYYGPYPEYGKIKQIYNFIKKFFPLRKCNDNIFKNRKRACIYYEMNQCSAPCIGKISEKEYLKIVENTRYFLEGKIEDLKEKLTIRMWELAKNLKFEQAQKLKEVLDALKVFEENQTVSMIKELPDEIIHFWNYEYKEPFLCLYLLEYNHKNLYHSNSFFLENIYFDKEEGITSFLWQYYQKNSMPQIIYLPQELEEKREDLNILFENKVKFPDEKIIEEILLFAKRNAQKEIEIRSTESKKNMINLKKLAKLLNREALSYIECYDISHFHGELTLGVRVVFYEGKPEKKLYRIYKIKKGVKSDVEALEEVLSRRLDPQKIDYIPDLIIVDGGIAQLNVLKKIRDKYDYDFSIMAIAKRKGRFLLDKVYIEDKSVEISHFYYSDIIYFIQKIRDETHRFAITSMKKRYVKKRIENPFLQIPGIGPKKAEILLNYGIEKIKNIKYDNIPQLKGLSKKDWENILKYRNKLL